jgi:hypothetical protein
MDICLLCVLSGRDHCVGPIARPEEVLPNVCAPLHLRQKPLAHIGLLSPGGEGGEEALYVPACTIPPTPLIIIIIIYTLLLPKGQTVEPGNLPKSKALSEIGEHWIERNLHFLSRL